MSPLAKLWAAKGSDNLLVFDRIKLPASPGEMSSRQKKSREKGQRERITESKRILDLVSFVNGLFCPGAFTLRDRVTLRARRAK